MGCDEDEFNCYTCDKKLDNYTECPICTAIFCDDHITDHEDRKLCLSCYDDTVKLCNGCDLGGLEDRKKCVECLEKYCEDCMVNDSFCFECIQNDLDFKEWVASELGCRNFKYVVYRYIDKDKDNVTKKRKITHVERV